MGAGNMMGGGGGSNPKLNAKNRGAFAVGGMGRPGNGGGAGTIPGLGINRDRWQGMNQQQRQGWRDMRQAGVGGAGAFANYQAAQNMRDRGQQLTQGALAAQNNAVPPENTIPAQDPQLLSQIDPSSERGQRILNAMSGTVPQQATTSPPADQAAPPPATSPPAQGAFTKQPRGLRTGLGGKDANFWRDVGYSPHFVSQLPGLLDQTMALNYGGMDPATVDWNDPRSIRRAAAFLPMDKSQFMNQGRPMGMKYNSKLWGDWKPGDYMGRGTSITPPYAMNNSGGG